MILIETEKNEPNYVIKDLIVTSIVSIMEFGMDALTLENARKYFKGGRSQKHESEIKEATDLAKKELFQKALEQGGHALSRLQVSVSLDQIKSDTMVTVTCQANLLVNKPTNIKNEGVEK